MRTPESGANTITAPQTNNTQRRRRPCIFTLKLLGIFSFVALNLVVISIIVVQITYLQRIHNNIEQLSDTTYAIVLGASVKTNGDPSDALRDRIDRGVELYKAGKVKKLLMTGDDGSNKVDEVTVMRRTAEEAGVPAGDILTDGRGYRTYESCRRAVDHFQITDAIIVTQRFHLARALFLCNKLGIRSEGYVADKQAYLRIRYFWFRDLLSSAKAFWDIFIDKPSSPVAYKNAIHPVYKTRYMAYLE